MKILHVIMFCCFSVVCVEASEVLEVKGYVGGEVSIHCSGNWTTGSSSEHSSVYFCKGVCSSENIIIHAERKRSAVTRRGRYSMEVDGAAGVFNVTVKKLKRVDAGQYHCGVGTAFHKLYPYQVSLIVVDECNHPIHQASQNRSEYQQENIAEDLGTFLGVLSTCLAMLLIPQNHDPYKLYQRCKASTVPPGSPPSTTTSLQTGAEALSQSSFPSSTAPSSATSTLLPSEDKRNQQGATKLTDTTVVIIVSGSLAFLICAIIPLIFYGHWRSNTESQNWPEGNKGEDDYSEGNVDAASAHVAVGLQSFEPEVASEANAQDFSQYAAVYQALDPKSLD